MATFGKTTIGATVAGVGNGLALSKYTLTEQGTISSLTIYFGTMYPYGGTSPVKLAIYDASYNLKGTTNEIVLVNSTDSNSWKTFPFASPVTLPAGVYYLGYMSSGNPQYVYDADPLADPNAFFETYPGGYPAFPATIGTLKTFSARNMSVYATYSGAVNPSPPVAAFTANPSTQYVGQPVAFNASASQAGSDGTNPTPIVNYAWSFGDGANGSGVSPTHVYSAAGTHTVQLIVTDSISQTSAPVTHQVIIQSLPTPSVALPASASGLVNTAISVTASPSGGSGSYTRFDWYVDGVFNSETPTPTFTFTSSSAGTVNLTVTVTDSQSQTSSFSNNCTVTITSPIEPPSTFGKSTVGATVGGVGNGLALSKYTLTEQATISSLTMYFSTIYPYGGTSPTKLAIYDASYNLKATTNEIILDNTADGNAWKTFPFASPVSLPAGVYYLGYMSSGNPQYVYDADPLGDANAFFETYPGGYPAFPATIGTLKTFSSRNMSIYATYSMAAVWEVDISVSPVGGGTTDPAVGSWVVPIGQGIASVSAFPANGFVFSHWEFDGVTTTMPIPPQAENSTHQLVAVFTAIIVPQPWHVTISVSPSGSGTTNPTGFIDVPSGQSLTATESPANGFVFSHWEFDGVPTTMPIPAQADNSTHQLVAIFTIVPQPWHVTISVSPSGSGTTNPAGIVDVPSGQSLTVTPIAANNYNFDHWELNSTRITMPIPAQADNTSHTLIAYFILGVNPPTVTLPSSASGLINQVVPIGASASGGSGVYTNYDWFVDDVYEATTSTSTFNFMRSNARIYNVMVSVTDSLGQIGASSTPCVVTLSAPVNPTLTLVVSPAGTATTTRNPLPPYTLNQQVTISVTVNDPANYTFVHWTKEDGSELSTSQNVTILMDTNHTYTAVLEAVGHPTLTVNATVGGSLAITQETRPPPYNVGDVIAVTATPSAGYRLAGWLRDGVAYVDQSGDPLANPITVVLDQSHTLTATFELMTVQGGIPIWWVVLGGVGALAVYAVAKK